MGNIINDIIGKRKNGIIFTVILAIFIFYGCNKNEEVDYTVSCNDTFTIVLPSVLHTAGYSWRWIDERKGIVDSLTREYINDDELMMLGSEGKDVWTFVAKKKGREKIVFVYQRWFDETSEEMQKTEFIVKVK